MDAPAIIDQKPAFVTDDNPVARLAYEVALQYFSEDDLCLRFHMDPETLAALKRNREFQRAVAAFRREIDEAGTEFRIKARKLASETLPVLGAIAVDPMSEPSDRIAAIKELARYAGYAKNEVDIRQTVSIEQAIDVIDAVETTYTKKTVDMPADE